MRGKVVRPAEGTNRFGGIVNLRILVASCVLAVTMAACGGSDPSKETGGDKTSETLLDAVPTAAPDRPTDSHTEVGALKFGAYVFDVVFYTLATNDIGELRAIADKKACTTCANLAANIKQRSDRVQVGTERHAISEAKVASHQGSRYTLNQIVKFPSGSEVVKKTGKEFKKLDGRELETNVEVQWRKGAWILLDYKAATNK